MRRFIQDQKSFSAGLVSSSSFARLGRGYFSSCKELINFIVNKDGGIRARQGLTPALSLPISLSNFEEQVEFNGLRFFRDATSIYFLAETADSEGVVTVNKVTLDFSLERVRGYDGAGNLRIDFALADTGIKDSHFGTLVPRKIRKIENQLIVFFENCYPFKVFLKDGIFVAAPTFARNFISGEIPNLAESFPFSKLNEELESGSFFYAKVSDAFVGAYSTQITPNLAIFNENLETKECLAYLDPGYRDGVTSLPADFYVDKDAASLKNHLGKPIIFSVGPQEISQDRLEYLKTDDEGVVIDGQTPDDVGSILTRAAKELYGNTNYENWDKEKVESDVFVPASVVLPLFLPIGFRFYCIVPYEIVEYDDADTIESEVFVKASDFYTSARLNRHGGDGSGKGFAKCKIFEIGYVVSHSYDQGSSKVRIIGGDGFNFPDALGSDVPINYSENFIVTDWANDFPSDGSFIQGKHFYFTQQSKLSFSKVNKPSVFSHPAKALLATTDFSYRYASAIYTYPEAADFVSEASSKGYFYEFLNSVKWIKDTPVFNVSDAFSYVIKASDGNTVRLLDFSVINVGNLNASGAQVITATDSGIYYWGFSDEVNLSRFLTIYRVADFVISPDFGLETIHNKVYFTAENRIGLYVVIYNERNRSFNFSLANNDFVPTELKRGLRFQEDRIFLLTESGTLYLANIQSDGSVTGYSEWRFPGYTFGDVFESDQLLPSFILKSGPRSHIYNYNEDASFDRIPSGEDVINQCEVELAPLTASRYQPFHGLHLGKQLQSFILFSSGIDKLEVGIGDKFEELSKLSGVGQEITVSSLKQISKGLDIPKGIISLKFRKAVGTPGTLGGVSIALSGDEIRA